MAHPTILILALLTHLEAAYTCPAVDVPFVLAGPGRPAEVVGVRFEQAGGRSRAWVTVRNATTAPIDGVAVNVELLDDRGNRLLTFDAFGYAPDPAALLPDDVIGKLTATIGGRSPALLRWRQPLSADEQILVGGETVFLAPSCPTFAKASVMAIRAEARWHALPDSKVNRICYPRRIDVTRPHRLRFRDQVGGLGDIALRVSVNTRGEVELREGRPALTSTQLSLLTEMTKAWRFYPSLAGAEETAQELIVLIRFGKPFESKIPEYVSQLGNHPLLQVLLSEDDVAIPTWSRARAVD
jgi:hypothetical protein